MKSERAYGERERVMEREREKHGECLFELKEYNGQIDRHTSERLFVDEAKLGSQHCKTEI